MTQKTKYIYFAVLLIIISLSLFQPAENIQADHTREHCDEQFADVPEGIRNAEIGTCYANVPDTPAEWRAYCDEQFADVPEGIRNAEIETCYAQQPSSITAGTGASGDTEDGGEESGEDGQTTFDPQTPTGGELTPDDAAVQAALECSGNGENDAESDSIVCQLQRLVNFFSVGVVIVAAITVSISGLQYLSARGDPNKTSQAIKRMIQVVVGLVTYALGWALIDWLIPGGVL